MGSSIAGLLSVSFNVKANAIGVGGLPGILSIQPKYMLAFAAIMLVSIAVPFVLTMIFRRLGLFTKVEDEAVKAPQAEALTEAKKSAPLADLVEIASPLSGQVKELSQATDPVFAQGVMGQGVLIEPSQGELLAPVDGIVSVLFPTKHAVGIVSDQGVEMLMHIGMDTVNLEGKGFTAHVSQGDRVKAGDKLISFDIDLIKDAGYVTETPVIITNQDQYQADALGSLPRQIAVGDALMTATKI